MREEEPVRYLTSTHMTLVPGLPWCSPVPTLLQLPIPCVYPSKGAVNIQVKRYVSTCAGQHGRGKGYNPFLAPSHGRCRKLLDVHSMGLSSSMSPIFSQDLLNNPQRIFIPSIHLTCSTLQNTTCTSPCSDRQKSRSHGQVLQHGLILLVSPSHQKHQRWGRGGQGYRSTTLGGRERANPRHATYSQSMLGDSLLSPKSSMRSSWLISLTTSLLPDQQ